MTKSLGFLRYVWLGMFLGLFTPGLSLPARGGRACTGEVDCTACQNCHGCQHCAKLHGTCGVEQRAELNSEQRERVPFAGSWTLISAGELDQEEILQPDGSAIMASHGVGRWDVASGHLFVRYDDPAQNQQTYAVSNGDPVLHGQDQAGHSLALLRQAKQPVSTALGPSGGETASMGSLPEPAPAVGDTVVPASQPLVPLSTCVAVIAAQSDPAKLGTLGSRATNPRLKRILYYLAAARDGGADPVEVIEQAQRANGSFGTPRAPLVKASLLRNLKICDGLGLFTPENRLRLRHGQAPVVTRGPYRGEPVHVDHIVPLAHAWDVDNELANLEMLPRSLNCAKGAKVGERQLDYARKFRAAGLLSEHDFVNLQARCKLSGTARYELPEL